jgi:hypothetical protein
MMMVDEDEMFKSSSAGGGGEGGEGSEGGEGWEEEEEGEEDELDELDIEWMLQMESEILASLKSEEDDILLEYYESFREQEMEAVSEESDQETMYATHLQHMNGDSSKVVLCPLCTKSYLLENRSVIFCPCGFRMDSRSDSIGLRHTKQALGAVMSVHSQSGCGGTLSFTTTEMFGSGVHLVAQCQTCQRYDIVL